MRAVFNGELEQVGVELATMGGLAADAMEKATRALLRSDLVLAEQVITDDEELDAAQARCEEHTFRLLSLQAPVARDLRLVVSAIQAAEKIERMGDLARHVAELTRRRHPACAVPGELGARFGEMARSRWPQHGACRKSSPRRWRSISPSRTVRMTGSMSCTARS
jgi:phosphate transport system protein